ncbi:Tm-1-like ATP-binding domain-containing protein [Geminicoccus flavidas]|uniref:Tm-1-like ATP-binding domain-containing protein n=1 Tax=Geminicoccus flavidas TaxID=2506407 RepID=UPI00135BE91E|nr:Tm-1-like ATP-binding domain-containing protein [Geminicoccus flavidas]
MNKAYVAGTLDTKGPELCYLRDLLAAAGVPAVLVDVGTARPGEGADITASEVAACHPDGESAVFTGDRGSAVAAMAEAFARFLQGRTDLGGVIGAGGSGNTTIVSAGMRALPVGTPKILVSTLGSGDVRPYVGASDICMMNAVTDVQGINSISRTVLGNAAHALAGMMRHRVPAPDVADKPAVALSMFGVTTPCVQAVAAALEDRFDCLVFHATGTGGQAMEKLVDSGLVRAVVDVTTTEIADELVGGILSAGPERLDAVIRTGVPWIGSVGALDMVNFGPRASVPERFAGRQLYVHNPTVTLMRTTPKENARIGAWLVEKINRMTGPVRFLLPLGGVSVIDVPGMPFHDPEADQALFQAIRSGWQDAPGRQLIELPHALNDPAFAAALVDSFHQIVR